MFTSICGGIYTSDQGCTHLTYQVIMYAKQYFLCCIKLKSRYSYIAQLNIIERPNFCHDARKVVLSMTKANGKFHSVRDGNQ